MIYTPTQLALTLTDYPFEIARCRTGISRIDKRLSQLAKECAIVELEIDSAVAADVALRNAEQRKVKREELRLSDEKYQAKLSDIELQKEKRLKQEITLEMMRAAFSVDKLQTRERIARLSDGAA